MAGLLATDNKLPGIATRQLLCLPPCLLCPCAWYNAGWVAIRYIDNTLRCTISISQLNAMCEFHSLARRRRFSQGQSHSSLSPASSGKVRVFNSEQFRATRSLPEDSTSAAAPHTPLKGGVCKSDCKLAFPGAPFKGGVCKAPLNYCGLQATPKRGVCNPQAIRLRI